MCWHCSNDGHEPVNGTCVEHKCRLSDGGAGCSSCVSKEKRVDDVSCLKCHPGVSSESDGVVSPFDSICLLMSVCIFVFAFEC